MILYFGRTIFLWLSPCIFAYRWCRKATREKRNCFFKKPDVYHWYLRRQKHFMLLNFTVQFLHFVPHTSPHSKKRIDPPNLSTRISKHLYLLIPPLQCSLHLSVIASLSRLITFFIPILCHHPPSSLSPCSMAVTWLGWRTWMSLSSCISTWLGATAELRPGPTGRDTSPPATKSR